MRARGLRQSIAGIKGIAGLAGGAIVIWIVYVYAGFLLVDAEDQAPGGFGGIVANEWLNVGLDVVLPATFVGLVLFGLIMDAVYSRRYT